MIRKIQILSLGLLLFSCGGKEDKAGFVQATMKPSAVEVFTIAESDVSRIIDIPGTIIPSEEIQLFSEITGRIQKINFKEGQRVAKGTLLVQVDTDILRAQKQTLKVQQDLAKKDEARKKALLSAKGISTEEYEKSAAALESIQAELALLDVQIAKGEIRAPFSGRIGLRKVSEGAYINPATMITTLVQDNPAKVEFSISERYASAVKSGQEVRFTYDGNNKEYKAKVFAYESFIDAGTRMLTLRADLPNDGKLIPGTFVSVKYDLGLEKNAMMIPAEAVVPVLKGQKVMVIRDGKVADVPVELGIRTSDKIQVIGNLKIGDNVLISGLLAVREGMPVTIKNTKK